MHKEFSQRLMTFLEFVLELRMILMLMTGLVSLMMFRMVSTCHKGAMLKSLYKISFKRLSVY